MIRIRGRLAQDIGGWLADGIISKKTHDLLRERYGAREFGIGLVVKYLGIAGGLLVLFGLLGVIAEATRSPIAGAFLLLLTSSVLTGAGIVLARDRRSRYPASSKVVLLLGVLCGIGGIGVALAAMDLDEAPTVIVTGVLTLPVVGYLAYRFSNIFLLILALLGFLHWVGTSTAMLGRSSYGIFISSVQVMSMAALALIGVGLIHELRLRDRTGLFFLAYEVLGLLYLDLSLLILSCESDAESRLVWIGLLTAAALAQIVAGARLHNGLFTGFGVTVCAVDLFTRYWEVAWDGTDPGVFFLLGGAALFAIGAICEFLVKRLRRSAP